MVIRGIVASINVEDPLFPFGLTSENHNGRSHTIRLDRGSKDT